MIKLCIHACMTILYIHTPMTLHRYTHHEALDTHTHTLVSACARIHLSTCAHASEGHRSTLTHSILFVFLNSSDRKSSSLHYSSVGATH